MATRLITDEAELGSLVDFLNPNKITALFFSKEDFLIHDTNIVQFLEHFLEANAENKPAVTREAFEFYWWLAVRKVFKTGDPDQERLLRQTRCPYFQNFVDRIYHGSGKYENQMTKKTEVQIIMHLRPRDFAVPTKAHSSGDIIIWTTYGNVLVPEIYLKSVQDVHFLDLGIKVSEANPDVVISYSRFRALWRTVMEKVYDFENPYETSKKIEEGLAVNRLDFELAVANIETGEYNERSTQRDTHFNGHPNESCSTGFDRDASAEIDKAAETKAPGSKKKKRRRRCKKIKINLLEAVTKIANEHGALLDLENSTPAECDLQVPHHGTSCSDSSSPAIADVSPDDMPTGRFDSGTE